MPKTNNPGRGKGHHVAPPPPAPSTTMVPDDDERQQLWNAMNDRRNVAVYSPLYWHEGLADHAQLWSNYMAANHLVADDTHGTEPYLAVVINDPTNMIHSAGENVEQKPIGTPWEDFGVVSDWRTTVYPWVGAACAVSDDGQVYVTWIFGTNLFGVMPG